MTVIAAPGSPAYDSMSRVALGIKTVSDAQRHCGFLYKGDEVRFLHLAFHFDLRDETAKADLGWVDCPIDGINQQVLAVYLSKLASNAGTIPYGFDASGSVFDPISGDYIAPPPGKGLTCATFISALLKSLGYNIVDLDTWPVRSEDDAFIDYIIRTLRQINADDAHISGVKASLPAKRLRPEEVVGAIPEQPWPVAFQVAEVNAKEVITELASLGL